MAANFTGEGTLPKYLMYFLKKSLPSVNTIPTPFVTLFHQIEYNFKLHNLKLIPDKILFIDTETGGLNPSFHSLLSIGLAVWQNHEIIDQTEILVNDGKLNVSEQAMQINQIDLSEHIQTALTPSQALERLDGFTDLHFDNTQKITLGGHNVHFDVNFLKVLLSGQGRDYHKRFSHRFVDTSPILYYLFLAGKLKQKATSSQEAFDLFSIQVDKRHSALGDALATADLFNKLLKV
jgi:DNA polymerase III subunit epsilon